MLDSQGEAGSRVSREGKITRGKKNIYKSPEMGKESGTSQKNKKNRQLV